MGFMEQDRTTYDDMLDICVYLNLAKTLRLVSRDYASTFKPFHLTPNQVPILIFLARGTNPSHSELASALNLEPPSLSRNINVLVKRGLVVRFEGEDRREKPLKLTEKGKTTLEKILPLWQEIQNCYIKKIGSSKWKDISNSLLKIQDISNECSSSN